MALKPNAAQLAVLRQLYKRFKSRKIDTWATANELDVQIATLEILRDRWGYVVTAPLRATDQIDPRWRIFWRITQAGIYYLRRLEMEKQQQDALNQAKRRSE